MQTPPPEASEQYWKTLRATMQSAVANGVMIAGLVLLLLNFACGMVAASVMRI